MKSEFEFAYALFLTGRDYRQAMIDCGVKALQQDSHSMYLALLAGADFDDTPTLLENFKKSALEYHVILPKDHEINNWLTIKNLEYIQKNYFLFTMDDEFNHNLHFICNQIKLWQDHSLDEFSNQLKKYANHVIDNYDQWLHQIIETAHQIKISNPYKPCIMTLIHIIHTVSYSIVTPDILEETRQLIYTITALKPNMNRDWKNPLNSLH